MKKCFLIVLLMCLVGCNMDTQDEKKIILDTDISSDADDVGAVAVLHNLANSENIEILAMMASSADPWSGGTLAALNSFYGRENIPLGTVGRKGVKHESAYTREIADSLDEQPYIADAVELYRKLLSKQPDNSVIIVSIGYLTNLKHLLRSKPDKYSDLTGVDLVQKKNKFLVCMGGQYPEGKEWNFYQDASSAQTVVAYWPTKIYFMGFELGEKIVTGSKLKSVETWSPVARSYELHNNYLGRPSWDQLAILAAVEIANGRNIYFNYSKEGSNTVLGDGTNVWQDNSPNSQYFLTLKDDTKNLDQIIDSFMVIEPD